FIALAAAQRVEPNDTPGQSRQPLHLPCQLLRLTSLQTVRVDDNDRPTEGTAMTSSRNQFGQRVADPSAPVPVLDDGGGKRQGILQRPAPQRPGDSGELGPEGERLVLGGGADEHRACQEQRPCRGPHRTGNVDAEGEWLNAGAVSGEVGPYALSAEALHLTD